jgi:quinol monooxygenase YgiN
MAIKVIVELKAHPGQRDELRAVFESMLAAHGSDLPGFLGSSRYEKLDDPDVLVEIADWVSVEAREAHMKDAAAAGTYAPLVEMVAEPFRVAVLSALA